MCEISETASDAWSTDVLASDTSERQAERLLELDQDEVASVSSRSQGQDDSVSETGDQPDDASQQSGTIFKCNIATDMNVYSVQCCTVVFDITGLASPGVNMGDSAASAARAGANHAGGAVGGVAFFPTNSGAGEPMRSTVRPERFSDPTNFCYQNYSQNIGASGNAKNSGIGDLVNNFQTIDQTKKQLKSDSKVNTSLQAFDPLAPSKSVETLTDTELNVNVNTNIGGSTQTLVPENMALSPDQGFASPGAHSEHSHFDPVLSVNRDSGLPSESTSLDTINEDVSGSMKLTEQQNVHIDGHRLSTAALTLFDPLMQESSTDPDELDTFPTGGRGSTDQATGTSLNRSSFSDQGARPKGGGSGVAPRISVQSSDQEGSGRGLSSLFDHPSKKEIGRPVPDQEIMKTLDGDNLSMHSTDSGNKYVHRGSTDSSNSSLVDLSTPRRAEVRS